MKFFDIITAFFVCVLGVCDTKPSIYNIQKRLKNLQSASNKNHEKTMYSMRYPGSDIAPENGRVDSVLPSENDKNEYIKKVLAQRHSHRPIVKTIKQIDGEDRLEEYVVNRLMKEHEHRQLKHKRACRGVARRLKTLKCPSDRSICLLDEMVCNDYPDCPDGEDENPAVCLIHDWAITMGTNYLACLITGGIEPNNKRGYAGIVMNIKTYMPGCVKGINPFVVSSSGKSISKLGLQDGFPRFSII